MFCQMNLSLSSSLEWPFSFISTACLPVFVNINFSLLHAIFPDYKMETSLDKRTSEWTWWCPPRIPLTLSFCLPHSTPVNESIYPLLSNFSPSLCFEYVIPSSPSDYDMFVSIFTLLFGRAIALHPCLLQFTLSISRHPIPLERQTPIGKESAALSRLSSPNVSYYSHSPARALSHMSHYKITFFSTSPLLLTFLILLLFGQLLYFYFFNIQFSLALPPLLLISPISNSTQSHFSPSLSSLKAHSFLPSLSSLQKAIWEESNPHLLSFSLSLSPSLLLLFSFSALSPLTTAFLVMQNTPYSGGKTLFL